MIKDYLIVAYLTAIAAWPATLALLALIIWLTWRRGWRVTGAALVALFVLVAIAAWEFERYL